MKKYPPFPKIKGVRFRLCVNQPEGYAIADDGTVWACRRSGTIGFRKSWNKMSPMYTDGYPAVRLSTGVPKRFKRIKIHTLVLEAFVGPRPPGMEACHWPDRDRTNARLSNLMWGTRKTNMEQKKLHGNHIRLGEDASNAKLTNSDVIKIRKMIRAGESNCGIARKFGVSHGTIWHIRTKRTWGHLA